MHARLRLHSEGPKTTCDSRPGEAEVAVRCVLSSSKMFAPTEPSILIVVNQWLSIWWYLFCAGRFCPLDIGLLSKTSRAVRSDKPQRFGLVMLSWRGNPTHAVQHALMDIKPGQDFGAILLSLKCDR